MIDTIIDKDEVTAIVASLAEAKSRQSVDDALAVYHPDGVLECPPWETRSQGKELRGALEGFFLLAPDYNVELAGSALDGDTLVSWGNISLTLTATFRGDTPNGQRITTPVFILFNFRDGRVIYESFHFDLADMAAQSGVDAASLRTQGQAE